MTEHSQADTGDDTPTIPSLVLHESRERRDKQDAKLHSLRQLSRGALIVLLSAGAIAVAASETLAPLTLRLVLIAAIVLTVATVVVEVAAVFCWRDGSKFEDLLDDFRRPAHAAVGLQLALINRAKEDYEHNEKVLAAVVGAIATQATLTVFALGLLVAGFGEL